MPASALAAIATPIRSFNSEIAIPTIARMCVLSIARDQSAEQPEFRQVFPVDEIIEHEADEEDRNKDDRARKFRRTLAAIVRGHRAAAGEQREGQLVAAL